MTAKDVVIALRRRHPEHEGEWLTYTEAWHIDFYAIRCWGSGIGHERIAYEIKVSRSDFRAEIRKPGKRANAVALSHRFYFAVPRGLVHPDEIPPDCGLLYVDDNLRTRIVKKIAPRPPRPFKLAEAIYLMRLPFYRSGILELRRAALAAEKQAEWAHERAFETSEELDRARQRLVAYAADRVVRGSMWRGRWQPHSWIAPVENTLVYVEDVTADRWQNLTLRRMDSGETSRFVSVEKLLTDFVPVDDPSSVW